jgi:anti-sigma factor RsiW
VNEFHTFVISHRELDYSDDQPSRIKRWFSDKVDFRTPLPVLTREMNLSGGRLCNILNQRVVSYMYLHDSAWVSLYIFKNSASNEVPLVLQEQLVKGYGYIGWQMQGLQFALIGDVPIDRLRHLAKAITESDSLQASTRPFIGGPKTYVESI